MPRTRSPSLRGIARRYGLRLIVLFGSRARGDASPGSDCDVCVSATTLRGDPVDLAYELSKSLHEDVDLCVFERIGPSLMWTIALEGRLLHGAPEDFERLRLRGIKECQDARKYLEASRRFLDRRLG